ncbi:MAG: hypothetical protein CME21_21950 [Gemmatimonadetes bacterium]|nr:hypothetical protein [Gemmatimonadota bacterium]
MERNGQFSHDGGHAELVSTIASVTCIAIDLRRTINPAGLTHPCCGRSDSETRCIAQFRLVPASWHTHAIPIGRSKGQEPSSAHAKSKPSNRHRTTRTGTGRNGCAV